MHSVRVVDQYTQASRPKEVRERRAMKNKISALTYKSNKPLYLTEIRSADSWLQTRNWWTLVYWWRLQHLWHIGLEIVAVYDTNNAHKESHDLLVCGHFYQLLLDVARAKSKCRVEI